jgi:hypothetical protein
VQSQGPVWIKDFSQEFWSFSFLWKGIADFHSKGKETIHVHFIGGKKHLLGAKGNHLLTVFLSSVAVC